MSEFNYERFASISRETGFSGLKESETYKAIAGAIAKYVNKDDIIEFYPKGMFMDDQKLIVYTFKKDSVIKFVANEKVCVINILRYKDIKEIEIVENIYNSLKKSLTIKFESEDIELNCEQDTNDAYRDRFADKIISIFKFLS
jgi:hypothetical protein